MIKTELIDVINSGDAWVFVGSGASCDSGCPSWGGLLDRVVNDLPDAQAREIKQIAKYNRHLGRQEYLNCFSVVEKNIGRDRLIEGVTKNLNRFSTPGSILRSIVDWPVKGYITTNYDSLLEIALRQRKQSGWVSVGNTNSEIQKVTGDIEKIVWHVHGSIDLSSDRSRLILTEEDYDSIYIEPSEVIQQLQAIIRTKRIIFVGFGFNDFETIRLLRLCGRSLNPSRPLYAFIGGLDGPTKRDEREDYIFKYNVDVIPYKVVESDHSKLRDMLTMYSSFIARRSIKYGEHYQCPSYNESTTGLMIYNSLVMRQRDKISSDVHSLMLKSLILGIVSSRKEVSSSELIDDIVRTFQTIKKDKEGIQDHDSAISSAITSLKNDGLLFYKDGLFNLSSWGKEVVANSNAKSEILNEQFLSCLKGRATELVDDEQSVNSICGVAHSFFNECIEKRALGVAMIDAAYTSEVQSYHIVGLMQNLPKAMSGLSSHEEAIALSSLVQNVLSSPNEIEKRYIGLSIQARFGIHMLGLDPSTVQKRVEEIKNTAFIIDSSTLIPLLARSSVGHSYSLQLVQNLSRCNSFCFTTDYFVEETAEHARYAVKRIDKATGYANHKTLATCLGVGGERSNAFLEGFVCELEKGRTTSFPTYLQSVCGGTGYWCKNEDVCEKLLPYKIACKEFSDFDGFDDSLLAERDEIQNMITNRRKGNNTYSHPRQTKAEAEALLIVKHIRNGNFLFIENAYKNSYFISYTRIIDDIDGGRIPITMRPESLYHWLLTVLPVDESELEQIFNGLVWELSERDMSIVDTNILRSAFSPYVYASQEKIEEELDLYRAQLSELYGEDYRQAFTNGADVYTPIVYESMSAQRALQLEEKLERETKKRKAAEIKAKLNDDERRELEKFKKKRSEKQVKHKRKQRAAQSNPKRKKKKK